MPGQTPTVLERNKEWLKEAEAEDGPDSPFAKSLREQIEIAERQQVRSQRFVAEAHNQPPGSKSRPAKDVKAE